MTPSKDCVDEATTTSYLLVLERHGLLHHAVERPFAKDSLTHWTHWAAVIRETDNGERFAIHSRRASMVKTRRCRWRQASTPLTLMLTARRRKGLRHGGN